MSSVYLRLTSLLLLLVATGCQSRSPVSGWGILSPRGTEPEIGLSIAPEADLPPEVESQQVVARSGSNMKPKAVQDPNAVENVDPAMMVAILDELESLGLNEEQSDQFKEDLKNAAPAYWPMMMQTLRTTLAFREQQNPAHDKPPKAEETPDPFEDTLELVEAEEPRPRVGSPGNWEQGQINEMAKQSLKAAQLAVSTPSSSESNQVPVRLPQSPYDTEGSTNPVIAAGGNDPFFDDHPNMQQGQGTTQQPPLQQATYQSDPVSPASLNQQHMSQRPTSAEPNPLPSNSATRDANSDATLNSTIAVLEREVAEARSAGNEEAATQREIRLRMLYMLAHRNEDALRPVQGLDASQQDYWSQQLYALATYLDDQREPDAQRRAAAANEFLAEATDRLSELSELKVSGLAFCTEVISFGVYKKFEEYKFQPGQQLLLYAEVENFFSEPTPKGHHTALKSSYELIDSRGQIVEEHQFELTEEYCQNARRDFFIRYFLYMPQRIYDGNYTLRLTIEDTLGHKVGQASIDLSVAGR